MKRRTPLIIIILIVIILLCGCGYVRRIVQNDSISETEEEIRIEENTVYAEWGEYQIPEGWEFCEEYTSPQDMAAGKLFFKEADAINDEEIHTNISVERGVNRYPAQEHERFRDAILKQLLAQTAGIKAQVTGSGSNTDRGYILYTFTVDEEEDNIKTVQYYVIGDKEYVLVHLTDYREQPDDDALKAAFDIAQSVVWNDYKE